LKRDRCKNITIGKVGIEVVDGEHGFRRVPTSQWHGNRQEIEGRAVIANFRADDGLRAQVALVRWPGGDRSTASHRRSRRYKNVPASRQSVSSRTKSTDSGPSDRTVRTAVSTATDGRG
jgi:hypothetical protein